MLGRKKARVLAFQFIYQYQTKSEWSQDIQISEIREFAFHVMESSEIEEVDFSFASLLINGSLKYNAEISDKIALCLNKKSFHNIPKIDLAILKIASYELLFSSEALAKAIIINESIEIGKMFSHKDSGKFINGVLDKISSL